MGWTSENVSKDFNISRARMDELAAISHQRAFAAQQSGRFDTEILPLTVLQLPKTPAAPGAPKPERVRVTVSADDGIRGDTTKEGLSKIRAAFPQWGNGTTTGGNASQITDGVAGVLLMTRRKAEELGLEILGKHICTSTGGLAPRIMGIVRLLLFFLRGVSRLMIWPLRRDPRLLSPWRWLVPASRSTTWISLRSTRRLPRCLRTSSFLTPSPSLIPASQLHDRRLWPSSRKDQRQRRCDRSWPPSRMHRCSPGRDRTRGAQEEGRKGASLLHVHRIGDGKLRRMGFRVIRGLWGCNVSFKGPGAREKDPRSLTALFLLSLLVYFICGSPHHSSEVVEDVVYRGWRERAR